MTIEEVPIAGKQEPLQASAWRLPFTLEATEPEPERGRRLLPQRRRALKRQLHELAAQLVQCKEQLARTQAELRRQQDRLLEQTRALEQAGQALEQETIRRHAAEALHGGEQPPASADTDDLEARRVEVHTRARSAIAELGSTAS